MFWWVLLVHSFHIKLFFIRMIGLQKSPKAYRRGEGKFIGFGAILQSYLSIENSMRKWREVYVQSIVSTLRIKNMCIVYNNNASSVFI
jgi:hypothetical protein